MTGGLSRFFQLVHSFSFLPPFLFFEVPFLGQNKSVRFKKTLTLRSCYSRVMVLRDGEGGGGVGIGEGHAAAGVVAEEARSPTNAPAAASDRQREPDDSSRNRLASSSLPTPLSRAVHYVLGLEGSDEDTSFLATSDGSMLNAAIVDEALKLIVENASTSSSSPSASGKVARIDVAAALANFAASAHATPKSGTIQTLANASGDFGTRIGGKAGGLELRSHPLGAGIDGGGATSMSSVSVSAPALSFPPLQPLLSSPPPAPPLDRATAVGELRLGGEGGSTAESWSNFASARSRVSVSLPFVAGGAGAGAGARGAESDDDDDFDDDGDDEDSVDDGEGAAAALLGGLFWGASAAAAPPPPPLRQQQQQQQQQQHRRAFPTSPRALPPPPPPPPHPHSPSFTGAEEEEEGEENEKGPRHQQQQLKWAYEVELGSGGIQQLGWATAAAAARFTNEEGTGDARGSFAFDGRRRRAWGGGGGGSDDGSRGRSGSAAGAAVPYGEHWSAGDVITCGIDLGERTVSFWRNGRALGVAFRGVKVVSGRRGRRSRSPPRPRRRRRRRQWWRRRRWRRQQRPFVGCGSSALPVRPSRRGFWCASSQIERRLQGDAAWREEVEEREIARESCAKKTKTKSQDVFREKVRPPRPPSREHQTPSPSLSFSLSSTRYHGIPLFSSTRLASHERKERVPRGLCVSRGDARGERENGNC